MALNNYAIPIASPSNVNEGYVYNGVNDNGDFTAIPDQYAYNNMQNFIPNLYDSSMIINASAEEIRYLNDEYHSTMNAMGVTSDASKGENLRPVGMETSGRRVYSSQNMATSTDHQLGSKMVNTLRTKIQAFDLSTGKATFSDEELSELNTVAAISQSPEAISELDNAKANRDSESFIDKVLGLLTPNKPSVTNKGNAAGNGAKGTEEPFSVMDGLGTAYQAYAMYQYWDYLSPAQKASGLATVGIKGFDLASGGKLGDKVLVDASFNEDGSVYTPELTLGQSLSMFNAGINAYGVAKNWDQLSDISKVVNGVSTVNSIMKIAQSFKMDGYGTQGTAISINAGSLAEAGYTATPQLGVGALTGPANAPVPEGYLGMASVDGPNGGRQVIIPKENASTGQGTTSSSGSTLNTAIGATSFALGAYSTYAQIKNKNYVGAAYSGMQTYAAYQQMASTGAKTLATTGTTAGTTATTSGSAAGTAAGTSAGTTGGSTVGTGMTGTSALGYVMAAYSAYMGGKGLYEMQQGKNQGAGRSAASGAASGAAVGAAAGGWVGAIIGGVVGGIWGAAKGLSSDTKGKHRLARDGVRDALGKSGVLFDAGVGENKNHYQVQLADGSYYDISRDGRSKAIDPVTGQETTRINPNTGEVYRPYEFMEDESNPLWKPQNVSLIALSAILTGNEDKYDQIGSLAGMLSGAAFSQGADNAAANIRAMFDRVFGGKDPEEDRKQGIEAINQLKDAGKIDEWEQIIMHRSINAVYNPENYKEDADAMKNSDFLGIDGVQDDMKDMYLDHLANDERAAAAEEKYQQEKVAAGGERTWSPPATDEKGRPLKEEPVEEPAKEDEEEV